MIDLYTAPTPNGQKASIALEELGLEYTTHAIDLGAKEQKEKWFLAMNPNGRIPVIKDRNNDDFVVFESGAILIYLAEKTGKLLPQDEKQRSQVIQWLMFQIGGLGPMMGQANVFNRYAEEKIPYAIDRYLRESRRLLEVLNSQLKGKEYLVNEYSIADIACYTWARIYRWSGVDVSGLNDLQAWLDRVAERPAVERGMAVPPESDESKNSSTEDKINTARSILG